MEEKRRRNGGQMGNRREWKKVMKGGEGSRMGRKDEREVEGAGG